MKKRAKKLVLGKETVGNLGVLVSGGTLVYSGPGVCAGETAATYYNSCLAYCVAEPIGPSI